MSETSGVQLDYQPSAHPLGPHPRPIVELLSLALPTFKVEGRELYRRLTFVLIVLSALLADGALALSGIALGPAQSTVRTRSDSSKHWQLGSCWLVGFRWPMHSDIFSQLQLSIRDGKSGGISGRSSPLLRE